MKKLYPLFIGFTFILSYSYGQTTLQAEPAGVPGKPALKQASSQHKSASIWTNNFDNPSDWIVQADDTLHGWLVTNSSVGWTPTKKIVSGSGGNYALFRNGNPTSSSIPPIKGKEWHLTTASPINLSSHPNVALTYQIWGMRFLDDLEIHYSTDNINWKIADKISNYIRTVTSTGINDFTNPTSRTCFLPEAGGAATVWIRLHWVNTSIASPANDGNAYSYQLDDFEIIEAPAKELLVKETFPGSNDGQTFYYQQIPLSQTHLIKPRIVVTNVGLKSQNVKATVTVLKDGTPFGIYSATGKPLSSNSTDTITVPTFTPSQKGLYTFNFEVTGDSKTNGVDDIESDLSDNISQEMIRVGHLYADDKNGLEWSGIYFNAFREGGVSTAPFASISAAQAFETFNNTIVNGVITVFPNGSAPVTIDQTLEIEIYEMSPETYANGFTYSDMELVARREFQIKEKNVFNPEDSVIYTNIEFTNAYLKAGFIYIVTITNNGGNDVYNVPVHSLVNRDASGSIRGNIQVGSFGFTTYTNVSPFILLDLDLRGSTDGIDKKSNFHLTQNFPNPFKGSSSFEYTLTKSGDVSLTITDITGKIISTNELGAKPAGNFRQNISSNELSPGMYFYSLVVDGISITRKMLVSE